jgi:hypothetical protein
LFEEILGENCPNLGKKKGFIFQKPTKHVLIKESLTLSGKRKEIHYTQWRSYMTPKWGSQQ